MVYGVRPPSPHPASTQSRETLLYPSRGHCYQLPRKTTAIDESNFFYRLLYRDILSFTFTDRHFYFLMFNSGLSVFIKEVLLLLLLLLLQ